MSEATRIVRLPLLHPGQRRVVEGAARFNVLCSGRRYGKTILGEDRVAETLLAGQPAAWFAPHYKVLDEAWRDLRTRLAPATARVSEGDRRIELLTGGVLECWSLHDNPDAGRSRKYARVIVDEAGLCPDLEVQWTQAIRPTLTDLKGDAWFLGTPKGMSSFFFRLFAKGGMEPGWAAWRCPTTDNPYIDAEEVAEARRDLPETAFRQEYLGDFLEDGGNPFGLQAIRECLGPLSTGEPVVWGWDLARAQDYTVGIALDRERRVCRFTRVQHPWKETEELIAEQSGTVPCLIDSTGVGDAVVESLARRHRVYVHGYHFTQASKQHLMERLRTVIHRRELTYPDGPIRSELDLFQFEYTKLGVRYSAPSGQSDDCVISLALAVQGWEMIGFPVASGAGPEASRREDRDGIAFEDPAGLDTSGGQSFGVGW